MKRISLLSALLVISCSSAANERCSGVDRLEDIGWYEKHMRAAGVRPLCATSSAEAERYRLIWLRSFHNPIVITLERKGAFIRLRAVRLDGAGGYKPGKIVERKTRTLTMDEFREFDAFSKQMDFWRLKTDDELRKEDTSETDEITVRADGAQWILEGATEAPHTPLIVGVMSAVLSRKPLYILFASQRSISMGRSTR